MQAAHPYTVQDQCEWHTLTPCKISASGTPLHSARSVRVAHSYTMQNQCEWHTLAQCKISGVAHPYTVQDQWRGTPLHNAKSV